MVLYTAHSRPEARREVGTVARGSLLQVRLTRTLIMCITRGDGIDWNDPFQEAV
jgi:hypothetical protein